MMEIRTKTMLEVFDELERDFCVVGVSAELRERQLLPHSPWRFESSRVMVNVYDDNEQEIDSREGCKSATIANHRTPHNDRRVEPEIAKHVRAQIGERIAQFREVADEERT
jgi:hypothetical protein